MALPPLFFLACLLFCGELSVIEFLLLGVIWVVSVFEKERPGERGKKLGGDRGVSGACARLLVCVCVFMPGRVHDLELVFGLRGLVVLTKLLCAL